MSFLNKLIRSFIRSGVNQVGRDGGRVLSNLLYKDAHSKPIRHVGSISIKDTSGSKDKTQSFTNNRGNILWNIITYFLWVVFLPLGLISILGWYVCFIPIVFVGRLLRPAYGYLVIKNELKDISKEVDNNLEFRSGKSNEDKSTSNIIINIKNEAKKRLLEFVFKFLILVIGYIAVISYLKSDEYRLESMSFTNKIKLINSGDTLYKNERFIYYYWLINTPSGYLFKETAYDTQNIHMVFIATDSLQINTDLRTDMEKVKGSPSYKDFIPKFKIMFRVKPPLEPITNYESKQYLRQRPNSYWYVNPKDVNIGVKKL